MDAPQNREIPFLLKALEIGGPNKTIWHWVMLLALSLALGVLTFHHFNDDVMAGQATPDLLNFFLVVMAYVVANVMLQYYRLVYGLAKSPDLKLFAEVFAAITLLSIGSQFLQLGTALDHQFGRDRAEVLQELRTQGRSLFGCTNEKLERSASDECNSLLMHFNDVKRELDTKNEESAGNEIRTFIAVLENAKKKVQYQAIAGKIDRLVSDLNTLDRSEKLLSKQLKLFPIISLWAAAIAVSTKVSIALFERNKKRKEEADKNEQEKNDRIRKEKELRLAVETLLAWKEEVSKNKGVATTDTMGSDLRLRVNVDSSIVLTSVVCLALAAVLGSRKNRSRH